MAAACSKEERDARLLKLTAPPAVFFFSWGETPFAGAEIIFFSARPTMPEEKQGPFSSAAGKKPGSRGVFSPPAVSPKRTLFQAVLGPQQGSRPSEYRATGVAPHGSTPIWGLQGLGVFFPEPYDGKFFFGPPWKKPFNKKDPGWFGQPGILRRDFCPDYIIKFNGIEMYSRNQQIISI